jgi:Flp pilus assembly protein TadD
MVQGNYEDALKNADKIIQYSENNAIAWFISGLILEKMGDSISAFTNITKLK